jgi:hypothetical protein
MIREPKIGMKAKVLQCEGAGVEIGDTVTITETKIYGDNSLSVHAESEDGEEWCFLPSSLTEIK